MSQRASEKRSVYFGVEVTRRCNLRCPHCYTDSSARAHPGVDTAALVGLVRDVAGVGARHVAFSGGEPLLRKDLEAIMSAGREAGIRSYGLVTNGVLADGRRVRSLKAAGLASVQVSIDGADVRDHCRLRACTPESYYRAIRAIRLFREGGVAVDVATILVGDNLSRGAEMLQLCEALGVRNLRYCSFYATGRAPGVLEDGRYSFDPDEADRFFELARSVMARRTTPVRLLVDHGVGPWTEGGALRCSSGLDVAYVSSTGDLYPCPALIFDVFKVGNVYETPLAELMDSPKLAAVRSMGRCDVGEPCRSCDNDACSGGCRGVAYAAFGDVAAAPPYCNVHRRRVRPISGEIVEP